MAEQERMTQDELGTLITLLEKFYNAYLALPADLKSLAAYKAHSSFDNVYDYVATKESDQR